MTDFDYLELSPLAFAANATLPPPEHGRIVILFEGTALLEVTAQDEPAAPCLLYPGDVWGLGSEPELSVVRALSPCQVWVIDRVHALSLQATDARFNRALFNSLAARMARLTLRASVRTQGKDSVLAALKEFAEATGEQTHRGWVLPTLSRKQLALYAGVCYQRTIILLKVLEDEGKILRDEHRDIVLVADSKRPDSNLLGETPCPLSSLPTPISVSAGPLTRPPTRAVR